MFWRSARRSRQIRARIRLAPFKSHRLLRVPGIDENDAKVFEVADVARGEGCSARGGDAGDLDVTDLDRSAD